MKKTNNQTVLDAVNAANSTHLTLNNVSLSASAANAQGDATAVLMQQNRIDDVAQQVTVSYKKLRLQDLFLQTPGEYFPSNAVTMKQLVYELDERFGVQFNGWDLLIDGYRVSNVFPSQIGATYVTDVAFKATDACAAYYGEVIMQFKKPGPLLYTSDPGFIESDTVEVGVLNQTGDTTVNDGWFLDGEGLRHENQHLSGAMMSDMYSRTTGDFVPSMNAIAPLEIASDWYCATITIAGVQCRISKAMSVGWFPDDTGPSGPEAGKITANIIFTLCFTEGTTAQQRKTVRQYLRTFSGPQGLLFLEVYVGAVEIASVVGYTSEATTTGSADPDLDDDSRIYFQISWQDNMLQDGIANFENLGIRLDEITKYRIVSGRKYHMVDRTSRVPCSLFPDGGAYPADYSTVEPAIVFSIRSDVYEDVIPTSFGKGSNYEYPVDYIQGKCPNLITGAGFHQKRSDWVTSLSTVSFPGNSDFVGGWMHFGKWNTKQGRILQASLMLASDTIWSVDADSGPITTAWESLLTSLRASDGWNEEIGAVCFLQYTPTGKPNETFTVKSLFMPKIVGNAVIFEGHVEYGNRPGTRAYSKIPNRMAIGNGQYYPN